MTQASSPATPAARGTTSLDPLKLANLAIVSVYALLLAVLLPEHEPWTDEAQSWLLARDASYWDLLTQRLRYEGTPALWTLLLSVPAKLGLPYESMQVIGALCAFGGVALLVFKSPFPLWLRALLPFTYFLAYQYAIVSRNYCLLALVLFSTVIAARRRAERYGPFAWCLGLLSHITLHATLMAGAIWLVEVARALHLAATAGWTAARQRLLALGLLGVNFVLILVQLWPPADILIRPPYNDLATTLNILKTSTAQAIGDPWPLGVLVLALLLPLLHRGRALAAFVLGAGFVYALLGFRYFSFWHTGTISVFTLAMVWWALDEFRAPAAWARYLAWAGLGIHCGLQIPGTYQAASSDYARPYSGSREAAAYLRKFGLDRRLVHGFDVHSIAVLPYFEHNFLANFRQRHPGAYYVWNRQSLDQMNKAEVLRGRPEYVLTTGKRTILLLGDLTEAGYVLERVFPGDILWRDSRIETDALRLYRRSDLQEPTE